jgi:nucleoside-diphosphate-sugar epimerase/choline dehydrogenase-like flavoprotein
MLDAGRELEAERQAVVSRMAAGDKTAWSKADRQQLTRGMVATPAGVPLKLAYGSDFPYRDAEEGIALERRAAGLKPSFARGGLSTVWGGAILPNRAEEMAGWPITPEELAPHYRSVHGFMPLSGRRDRLEELFPLHGEPFPLPLSRQAEDLLTDLTRQPLAGLTPGQARLALDQGCVACGLCLYGCPYGLIYNSAATVEQLRSLPNFTYRPGCIVQRIEENSGGVIIHGTDSTGALRLEADTLFLAAGVLPTSRIMLASLEAYDHPLRLLGSHYFLFPLLRPRRTPGAVSEELHTLCQLFLELEAPQLSRHTIHLQCYTYNDLYARAAARALGPFARLAPLTMFLERLLLVQGYLHSDSSPAMQLSLGRDGRLALTGEPVNRVGAIVRGVMDRLRPLGLPFAPRIGLPGEGFHCGGTFPMRHSPAPFESDPWGRPHGFQRVHIVDASVLPSIPATTITYTLMANAHRIASAFGGPAVTTRRGKRCAVSGANGYVGGGLAAYLRTAGFAVIPLVRRPDGPGRRFALEGPADPAALEGTDCLVHAAYDFLPLTLEESRRINVEGSRRLFAAAREAGVRRIIYISSLSAMEGCSSGYATVKREIEAVAREYGAAIIRPGLVYGERPGGMVGALQRLAAKRIVPLADRGEQLLYLTHQEDLGRLVHHLLRTSHLPAEPLPAAAAAPLTMREIIGRLAPRPPCFVPLPGNLLLHALRLAEACGYRSRLRSDSLVSLLSSPPAPDFSALAASGISFRAF